MSSITDQIVLESEYRLEDRSIPVENGEISVRCLFPTPSGNSSKGPYPLLVWYHGGGTIISIGPLQSTPNAVHNDRVLPWFSQPR